MKDKSQRTVPAGANPPLGVEYIDSNPSLSSDFGRSGESVIEAYDGRTHHVSKDDDGEAERGRTSSEGFSLNGEGDLDVVLLLYLAQESNHDFWSAAGIVVASRGLSAQT